MLSIPVNVLHVLLKHESIDRIVAATMVQQVTKQQIARELNISYRVARRTLDDLANAEFLIANGRKYTTCAEKFSNGNLLLNLRDVRLDLFFRRRSTRQVLLHMLRHPKVSARELAKSIHVPVMTVSRIQNDLRIASMADEKGCIKPEFIYSPQNPVASIPRRVHRQALAHFLYVLQKRNSLGLWSAIVMFGDASYGKPTPTLELAVVFGLPSDSRDFQQLLDEVALAAENVTGEFGALFSLYAVTEDAWLGQKLGLVTFPNSNIARAFDVICIHGKLPQEEDLFEIHQRIYPMSIPRITEKIEKGSLKQIGTDRYAYTDKALANFKKKLRENVIETPTVIRGKRLVVVSTQLARATK